MTMEEYIKLEEEKARRRGRVFNWRTATYGKIRIDDNLHDLRSVEAEFPAIIINDCLCTSGCTSMQISNFENEYRAIVYNDARMSKSNYLTEQTLSPRHKNESNLNDETSLSEYDVVGQNVLYFNDLFTFNIIHPNDLKSDEDNDYKEIDIIQSSKGNEIIHGSSFLSETSRDKIWHPYHQIEQRNLFLRYQGLEYTDADIADFEERLERIYNREIHRVQVVDFQGMPELMRDGLFARMVMEHRDDAGVVVFTNQSWGRLFDTRGPLVWELILEFLSTLRFGEVLLDLDALDTIQYWSESKRMIPGKGDLHDYWRGISTDGDFLGPPPSYTLIRDPMLRLCHRMMAHSIAGRSQAPEKVTVTDLFYLRGLDVGSVNIPYLLALILRSLIILGVGGHGRKRGSPMLLIVAPTVAEVAPAVLMRVKCLFWHPLQAPQQPTPPPTKADARDYGLRD
ncbi:hypothetical protein Tco_0823899 [Tanacetum coccineum]|uniref:Uncharacterized protein n=1 Tax=Tanacetum coccineum TaxID=301880 RepID=A0ABQ5AJA2_9ASTR